MAPKAKGSYFGPKHLEQTTLSHIHFIENAQGKATLKGLYRTIGQAHQSTTCDSNQEVEGLSNLIVECESEKIMGKKNALVLEYLIFCVFEKYSKSTFMNIYNVRTRDHPCIDTQYAYICTSTLRWYRA